MLDISSDDADHERRIHHCRGKEHDEPRQQQHGARMPPARLRMGQRGGSDGPKTARSVATGPMTLRGGHALDTSNANADDERLQHRCA